MRNILISTMPPVLALMTVLDVFSILMMFRTYREDRSDLIALLTGILCIGLFYDSLILTCGSFLNFGPVFRILSQFRYILHCVLIPLLFPICARSFSAPAKVMRIVWVITIIVMIAGLIGGISIVTEERTVGAIRRYAESDLTLAYADRLVSFLDIFPVFLMMGIGIVLTIRKKNPYLFLAGFFMFLFTMLGIFLGKDPGGDRAQSLMFYISMFGESLMVFFLYLFIRRNRKLADN